MTGRDQGDGWRPTDLRFECRRSGRCCTGPPGRVWFSPEELRQMARHLDLLPFEFLERHCRRQNGRWSLREIQSARGYDCVFLEWDATGRSACSIHPVRPSQCRSWPFWPENLKSEETYRALARLCPGVRAGLANESTADESDESDESRGSTDSNPARGPVVR